MSAEQRKLERLQHEVEEARLAAKKREQLLVDPNRFTDACAPGFRVYFTGQAADRMTFDDKKVIGKALKDRHCSEKDLLCTCDMAQKQNAKSILEKVNAGVDCECFDGLSKDIREAESQSQAVADQLAADGADAGGTEDGAGAGGAEDGGGGGGAAAAAASA